MGKRKRKDRFWLWIAVAWLLIAVAWLLIIHEISLFLAQ